MTTKILAIALISALAFTLAACSKEAPPVPAAKKEDAKPDAGRPMPPAAPTAAPAEGDAAKKPADGGPGNEPKK